MDAGGATPASATAAASSPAKIDADRNGTAAFAPSVWGDFFATYVPPPTQVSEEWMRERVEELKRRVSRMFKDGEAMGGVADTVALVDTLERLGLDSHFREEIAVAIGRIHVAGEGRREFAGSDDLHVAATRFRLLRQHGFWVSADVFDKFRDSSGNFSATNLRLSSDGGLRALLSLYHAAHMAVPGESALDDAIEFARRHLQAMNGELRSPAAEQVSRALDHPLPRYTRLLETMRYVAEYAQEEVHDGTLLELARLNSNLMRSLHLKELKALTLWWRDIYNAVNLTYSRDRMVEIYLWSCGMIPEEEHSRGRLIFAKTFGIVSFLDDTFDVHATLEESRSLNEAFQRWDESAVSILPEYLRMLYIKTLSNFKEFEDLLEPQEKYRMFYVKKAYQLQSAYYMQEAEWTNDKYQPSFAEHEELSTMSTGLPMLNLMALMGYDGAVATQEVFDWMSAPVPDMVRAGAVIGRFLNDISSYRLGKNKNDVGSSVECYMQEKGVTGQEAVAAIAAMTEHRWRLLNRACMETKRALLPAVQLVASIARTCEVIYLRGRDGYTFGSHAKDLVTALFLDPIPL
ncbi:eudesmanediol synthase-like [Lolium rigidum]|uniref:eudesmanediol synthase-like n=1 Tax=Lolium rigidum TaxID=89674 RepID=UPI001F5CBD0D|nr:eudesmanediol synthase-like [Lolium rigidum]